jgi:effector-binding domain-containing protein
MRNYLFMMLLVLIAGCQSSELTDKSIVQNPNAGEFGEAGAHVQKTYAFRFEKEQMAPSWYISAVGKCHQDSIRANFTTLLPPIFMEAIKNSTGSVSKPISQIKRIANEDSVYFNVGILTQDSISILEGCKIDLMYTGNVLKMYYYGSYEKIEESVPVLTEYLSDNDLIVNGEQWAQYISDPEKVEQDSVLTIIYQPIK